MHFVYVAVPLFFLLSYTTCSVLQRRDASAFRRETPNCRAAPAVGRRLLGSGRPPRGAPGRAARETAVLLCRLRVHPAEPGREEALPEACFGGCGGAIRKVHLRIREQREEVSPACAEGRQEGPRVSRNGAKVVGVRGLSGSDFEFCAADVTSVQ